MRRWPIILLCLVLFAGAMLAPARAGGLYRCSAEEVRRLGEDGLLGTYPDSRPAREALGDFIIDTDTGSFRGPAGATQWRVVQQGSENSDFVATPGLSEKTAITDFIRVRAWRKEPGVTFFRVGLTTVITGRCEAIR